MATTFITTNTFGNGPLFTYTAASDHLVIIPGVTLGSSIGTAIAGTGLSNISLTILGTLITRGFPTFSGSNAVIQIAAGGSYVSTEDNSGNTGMFLNGTNGTLVNNGSYLAPTTVGILSQGDNHITNTGTILAATPLLLGLVGGADEVFLNAGTVTASAFADATTDFRFNNAVLSEGNGAILTNLATGILTAVSSEGAGVRFNQLAGGSVLKNHGQIISQQDFGVNLGTVSLGQAAITVQNWGTISGFDGSYNGSVNADVLLNRGLMVGNVNLGAGDDVFDTRSGVVTGEILAGDGNDRIITNVDEAEDISGGAGTADVLDFRYDIGVTLALDGAFESDGAAFGDSYAEFENVYGSLTAADRIGGNGAANYLFSGGGNDVLDGAAGHDILRGGIGSDRLTGGDGNDSFRFMALNEAGDVITDFSSTGAGNNDRFQIGAVGFAGGLTAGALASAQFQNRADNLAQDADDRFIFRTTDQTLWYDADGNGAGAALMIADLQASANVTYQDIVII